MKVTIQRLRAEIASDRRALGVHLRELESLRLGATVEPGDCARAAVALHHAYSAVETILVRVARVLEGALPEGPDWHQALLESMALELEGIRNPILRPEVVGELRQLLGFRHFFRHAYSVSLDGARLADLRELAIAVEPALSSDLDRLDATLRELASD